MNFLSDLTALVLGDSKSPFVKFNIQLCHCYGPGHMLLNNGYNPSNSTSKLYSFKFFLFTRLNINYTYVSKIVYNNIKIVKYHGLF